MLGAALQDSLGVVTWTGGPSRWRVSLVLLDLPRSAVADRTLRPFQQPPLGASDMAPSGAHCLTCEVVHATVWPVATGTHVASSTILSCVSPLPGSVLVPVPGGGTKQPCMFHHLGCWFGSVVCSKFALWVTARHLLQRLALSRWGEVLQLA